MDFSLAAMKLFCIQLKDARQISVSPPSLVLHGIRFQRAWCQGVLISSPNEDLLLDDGSGVVELSIQAESKPQKLKSGELSEALRSRLRFPLFLLIPSLDPYFSYYFVQGCTSWLSGSTSPAILLRSRFNGIFIIYMGRDLVKILLMLYPSKQRVGSELMANGAKMLKQTDSRALIYLSSYILGESAPDPLIKNNIRLQHRAVAGEIAQRADRRRCPLPRSWTLLA
ncbi:hypothetical protein KSP40_PGU016117 [Platanthera guangdongensis]|uniref:Uncharacterized protein n=1 Tax=Platanthera guangdongensis TaxID=2320717 RepID=A0ABR2MCV3_9ASPA